VSEVPAHEPGGLTEADLGPDPIARLVAWLDEARNAGVRFPEAAALATADPDAAPAVRHVLVKGVDERGLTFFTNRESRKGRQLAVNPNAGPAFYWRELDRQVCVTGGVSLVDDAESDKYFRTRPREARIGAWASRQSRPVSSRGELDAAFAEIAARFPGKDVPLPPHWGGYPTGSVSRETVPHGGSNGSGRSPLEHGRTGYRSASWMPTSSAQR
jgi:pyridoxamine 5'-phosphate oxidase